MNPGNSTRMLRQPLTGSTVLVENGDPIIVHNVIYTNTTGGGDHVIITDASGTTNLLVIRTNLMADIDVVWLADGGIQLPADSAGGLGAPSDHIITIFYRPTG